MKVLHIGKFYPPYPGGIETFLHDLLWTHAAMGVECGAVVHVADPVSGGRGKDGNIRLWQARSHGSLLYAPVSPGFPVWITRAIREFSPDILHLHMPNTSAFWSLALPTARRIPTVVHWHADVITPLSSRLMRSAYVAYHPFEQALLHRARAVIATSPTYLESSEPLTPWRAKCHCIPLGLPLDDLAPVSAEARQWAASQWLAGTRRVLAVGRLSHYKGFKYLVEAVRLLPEAHCLIVGDGEMRTELRARIENCQTGQRVHLTGRLPNDRLHALLESCEVFCLPSIERTEAFGLVLVEAMARRKPLVACRIPGSGVGWVVQDGRNGLLAEPMNPVDLADKIRQALARPELGIEGYNRVSTELSMNPVTRRILDVYRAVLNTEP